MYIAALIAGIGLGIGLHRLLMSYVLGKVPDTYCAYCEWSRKRTATKGDGSG